MRPILRAALVVAVFAAPAVSHVSLNYPWPESPHDFLDGLRSAGPCGLEETGASTWVLANKENPGEERLNRVTTARTGTQLNVSWTLTYPHRGGFAINLLDANFNQIQSWDNQVTIAQQYSVDATQQFELIDLPATPCSGCHLQFVRQALEWGAAYQFRSCARIDITSDGPESCFGCSGHGTCADGKCECEPRFDGTFCQRESECVADADCGEFGVCVDTGPAFTTEPRFQCYCREGYFGSAAKIGGIFKRTCNRESSLEIGDFEQWADEYPASQEGVGGNFAIHWKVLPDNTIEFAMRGRTSGFVALGLRPSSLDDSVASSAPAGLGMDGTCRSTLYPSQHGMTNQDMYIGFAQGSIFRISDYFTPSRSTPISDAWYGGTDGILDAVGREAGGVTLLKFRRLLSPDQLPTQGDYCIAEGVYYNMVWAIGQDQAAPATPVPNGAGDLGFYGPAQLKFHGASSSRRGSLGEQLIWADGRTALGDTGGGLQCKPSPLEGMDCTEKLGPDYTAHWRLEEGKAVHMAVESPSEGYVAFAWARESSDGVSLGMDGAEAIIGSTLPDGTSRVFTALLSSPERTADPADLFTFSGARLENVDGTTTLYFSRPLDARRRLLQSTIAFAGGGSSQILWSYGPVDAGGAPGFHTKFGKAAMNFATGTTIEIEVEDLEGYRKAHGALMTVAWGVIIPAGILAARFFKSMDPLWFRMHMGFQCIALLLAIIAWAIALNKFQTPSGHKHLQLGMAVMVIGIFQPFNALARPTHEAKWRPVWELVHKNLGRATAIMAIVNCFYGLDRYEYLYGPQKSWHAFLVAWTTILVFVACAMEYNLAMTDKREGTKRSSLAQMGLVKVGDDGWAKLAKKQQLRVSQTGDVRTNAAPGHDAIAHAVANEGGTIAPKAQDDSMEWSKYGLDGAAREEIPAASPAV